MTYPLQNSVILREVLKFPSDRSPQENDVVVRGTGLEPFPFKSFQIYVIVVISLLYSITRTDDTASLYNQQYKSDCHSSSPQCE